MSMERTKEGHYRDRVRAGGGKQLWLTVPVTKESEALARFERLRTVSQALTAKGLTAQARVLLRRAASRPDRESFDGAIEMGLALAPTPVRKGRWVSFRHVGEAWTSGELHRLYPDYVKAKKTSARDAGRLALLYPTIGDVPLAEFTREHFMLAMRELPDTAKRPASRRHYAQVIVKVLRYGEFPCEVAPYRLPKGVLPKVTKGDVVFPFLYPSEDLALLGSSVALPLRVLVGLINREGLRTEEALTLEWARLDREHGVISTTGKRKNGRIGSWPASPGTLEGLYAALRDQTAAGPFEGLPRDGKYAERVRAALKAAGISRAELFEGGEGRRRLRAHDLRATFVTLALARGESEGWIMRRTGHSSSGQIHAYDHAASSWRELELGELVRLDAALGLANGQRNLGATTPNTRGGGETRGETDSRADTSNDSEKAESFQWVAPAGLEPASPCGRGILKPSQSPPEATEATPFRGLSDGRSDAKTPRVSPEQGGVRQESHPSSPASALLEQLRRAAHAAVDAGNWETVRALGPLIEAEEKRATQAAPVSLEVVRAKREGK